MRAALLLAMLAVSALGPSCRPAFGQAAPESRPESRPESLPESLAQSAARRFPQPVRAGELVGRDVLQPIPSQARLGRVLRVTRGADSTGNGPVRVVIGLGGLLGFGVRPVAVPADGLALLGDALVAVAYTPAQLAALPTDDPASSPALDPATIIRMGLAKPAH